MGYIYAKNGATQQTVTTAYAADGRIASAGFMHGGVLRNFTYGYLPGSNLLEKLTMPNNMTLTQGYEAKRDLLTGMTYMRSDALVTQRSYSYDALGRPTQRDTQYPGKDITHSDTFEHNSRSDLVNAQLDDASCAYTYDNIGKAANGYLRTTYTYAPYGAVSANGDVSQPIQWSSEYADEKMGLIFYNYGHYNPLDGRWLSRDSQN